jgi:hypothetical protein
MEEQSRGKLESETAVKYLSVYLGETQEECLAAVGKLWPRLVKQYGEGAPAKMKELISFTVLFETYTKSRLPEKPINLLFYSQKYDTLNDREWWPLLAKIIQEDKEIEKVRNFCLNLGVVNPIEYSPPTRQAFHWLMDRCPSNDTTTSTQKVKSLVYAYGGDVINGVFEKDKELFKIKKLPNHDLTYFFERLIFQFYSAEKIVKIKKLELNKTSPKLVVKLKK